MKPLFKVYFGWKEPKAYLQLKDRHELPQTRRAQPFLFIYVMALFMFSLMFKWWVAQKAGKPAPSLVESAVVAVGLSAFLVYGVPWIVLECPSLIRIREKTIARTRGSSNLYLHFRKLDSFCWIPMRQWFVLRFKRKSGRPTSLAVPMDVPRNELTSFLEERGLRKESDGHWADFEDLAFLRDAD